MTDFVAADVTITVAERQIVGKKRRARVTIAFGNGSLTYPSGGIPLPTFASWGMIRNIDFVTCFDSDDASGIIWKYDRTNHKLRGYVQGASTSGALATGLSVAGLLSSNTLASTGAAVAVESSGAAASGVIYQGVLKELLAGTHAPAAQTLQAEAVGW